VETSRRGTLDLYLHLDYIQQDSFYEMDFFHTDSVDLDQWISHNLEGNLDEWVVWSMDTAYLFQRLMYSL